MNICVFDTETTGLDKPYCYNIGYAIVNTDDWSIIVSREYIVEQIWHNNELFNTAYYANKRSFYVSEMRARKITMDKFGYITRQMYRDFIANDIHYAYAYNSSFDERVFNFNCDWFKTINPFDSVAIFDIRGFAHEYLVDDVYKDFCEKNQLFSESGNYSTTAETMTRYIRQNNDFVEDHTALSDTLIEMNILHACVDNGADLTTDYKAKKSIERKINKTLTIKDGARILYSVDCTNYSVYKKTDTIKVKLN